MGRDSATKPLLQIEHVTRLEDVATRLADGQDSIETRLAEMADRQERRLSENADQLADLADRIEFAERMVAQQKPVSPASNSEDEGLLILTEEQAREMMIQLAIAIDKCRHAS